MTGNQTFYSFAATLIPALLFGTVRTALTPQSVGQKAQELLAEWISDARAGFQAGWAAYEEYHKETVPEAPAERRARRLAQDEAFQEMVTDKLESDSRRVAATRLRREAVTIVVAVSLALAAEGAALYGAIVGSPGTAVRDTVVLAVLVGMMSTALAAFWPWMRHLSTRSRIVSGVCCALALGLSMALVLRGFSQQPRHNTSTSSGASSGARNKP
jgi:hypothetical protein